MAVTLKVDDLARKLGIANAAELSRHTGLGLTTCYQLWEGTAKMYERGELMIRTDFYCVIQADGAYCTWSIRRNRTLSWRAFAEGLSRVVDEKEVIKRYQKEGCRCVAVRVTLAEKGKKQ